MLTHNITPTFATRTKNIFWVIWNIYTVWWWFAIAIFGVFMFFKKIGYGFKMYRRIRRSYSLYIILIINIGKCNTNHGKYMINMENVYGLSLFSIWKYSEIFSGVSMYKKKTRKEMKEKLNFHTVICSWLTDYYQYRRNISS